MMSTGQRTDDSIPSIQGRTFQRHAIHGRADDNHPIRTGEGSR
jgi:hypothetical protein